jgi:hypothetical protein
MRTGSITATSHGVKLGRLTKRLRIRHEATGKLSDDYGWLRDGRIDCTYQEHGFLKGR